MLFYIAYFYARIKLKVCEDFFVLDSDMLFIR